MKKSYTPISDVPNETVDLTKRLYRTISDAAHQLDEVRGGARCVDDLFTPAANLQRARLRDASERLLLQTAPSPTAHAQTRKTEELLWRKVYYEVIATAKRIRKGNNSTSDWQTDELVLVHHHITAGLGFYHHLLWRLQCEFSLEMNGLLDCLVFFPDEGLKKGKSGGISNGVDKMAADEGTGRGGGGGEWANQMAHRCLIYLGDLCRYLVDVQPGWDYGLATHYYTQALLWKPDAGLPHNQLGTMAGSRNYSLDAVYHYMRCLCCAQTFEGTEGNLNQLIDKGVAQLIDNKGNNALARTVARLLCCARTWFCNRPPKLPMHKVCDDLLVDLRECLHAVEVVEPIEEPDDIEKFAMVKKINEKPTRMTEEIMFKSIAIVMMCLHNLDKKGSSELSRAVSLQLSMMAQVLHQIVLKVEAVLPPPPTPPPLLNGLANRRRRQRRRRKHRNSSDDDDCDNDLQSSDLSEGEEVVYVSGTDSDASEEKLIFDQNSSDSEDEVNGEVANGNEAVGSVQNGSKSQHYRDNLTFQHLHRLSQQGFILQTIKICFDWLSVNVETMKACGQTCKQFLDHAVTLFNHLLQVPFTFDSNNDENLTSNISDRITISENLSPLPLPEDVCLRDLPPLVSAQLGIDWQKGLQTNISSEEETYLRIYRLLAVGLRLAKVDDCACGWSFASRRRWFVVAKGATAVNGKQRPPRHNHNHNQRNHKSTTVVLVNKNNKKKNIYNGNADKRPAVTAAAPDNQENGDGRTKQHQQDAQKHDQLMANMGQLWLRAEVKELETKVRRSAQHQRLPPYLVLDADALTQHFALTKQLVVSKKFIVLIPSVVVSSLDEQKKESSGVRETIRWLEGQFRHGNRFVRAQRPNEHLPLPLIKYPKKKDREAWLFFQIVECCHFLSSQGGKSQGLVTLLTGSPTLLQSSNSNGFSPLGIASTAGISIEYIESFHSKWKSSSKSHG